MKIAFHLENLTLRGTTVAVKDYAKYNKEILNNESIFFYKKGILDNNFDENCIKRQEIFAQIFENYESFEYNDIEDLEKKVKIHACDFAYFLKAGFDDGMYLKDTKSLIHCVFNNYQPHGYKYSYISKWLAKIVSSKNSLNNYVPHIVNLPKNITVDLRQNLKISSDKFVVGRYGGFDQFDIPFVYNVINYLVNNDDNIIFIFINTRKFIEHKNVLFLNPIIDPQDKSNFISACDIMLHGRSDGESFGLSICEFLFHNKPVLSFGKGRDKNNVELLENVRGVYNSEYELLEKFFNLKYEKMNGIKYDDKYSNIILEFSPENVMKRFDEIFLRD